MKTTREYHYVYYSYEEWGRGYIGSRTCKCPPEEDTRYFGSFSDKTFKPTRKIILRSGYASRKEAYEDEIALHKFYSVVENAHFANRAYQTSTGFSRKGYKFSEEEKKSLSKRLKGLHSGCNNPMYGKKGAENPMYGRSGHNSPQYGRKRSEKTKRGISQALSGRKLSKEHISKIKDAKKGTFHFTNGLKTVVACSCPTGFYRGRTMISVPAKKWVVNFENNEREVIFNLRKWCKEKGYNYDSLIRLRRKLTKKYKNIISVCEYKDEGLDFINNPLPE